MMVMTIVDQVTSPVCNALDHTAYWTSSQM